MNAITCALHHAQSLPTAIQSPHIFCPIHGLFLVGDNDSFPIEITFIILQDVLYYIVVIADFGYTLFMPLGYLLTKVFQIIQFSILMTMSVPDEGYSRNARCALNQIYVCFLFYPMQYLYIFLVIKKGPLHINGRGRDRMVVEFTTSYAISAYITTKVVSSNPADDR